MTKKIINIFTDGSCHPQLNIGGWAAILLFENEKIILKGKEINTTHNRMELLAVIRAIEFAHEKHKNISLVIHTDSQYVFRIPERMEKLKKNNFITKKGYLLHNNDLIEALINKIETYKIEFVKVKAHQRAELENINYNIEVDKLARQIVRDAVYHN
jgi:ribonuclease HI